MEMEYTQDVSPGFLVPTPSFRYSPVPIASSDLSSKTPTPPAEPVLKASTPQPRTNRVKRPHTKSRGGCFNCKSRRIKCQETKPACANCIHKDLDCFYPTDAGQGRSLVASRTQSQIQRSSHSASPRSGELSSPSPGACPVSTMPFTGDDLRFWHHFLIDARPHLPFGSEDAWLSRVPAFAHECPALLHAMLSLGASHCSLTAPNGAQYGPVAIAHRGKALKALSAVLAKGDDSTVAEMDGALATCYTLTFQAHHMSDGVVDFAVMVRGCGLVTQWYLQQRRDSAIFPIQSNDNTIQMITSWLPWEPQHIQDEDKIISCIAALDSLQPFLQSPAHHAFYNALRLAYQAMVMSHRDAFTRLSMIYVTWGLMDNVEFLTFIAPGNHVSRALFVHYILVDSFLLPVHTEIGRARNLKYGGGHFMIYRWAETVYAGLPESLQELVVDTLRVLAVHLLSEVATHRETFPMWLHHIPAFMDWARKRVLPDEMVLYNVE
ncbi:C6 zinc finger domain protein [Aspergillus pseudodeflectus]|uniref:C6 zinc finger domain protein n=1 Tax=Aspergillus pseudodeflectus TaxID=176178 RepID=A0ABR4JLJ4_9EURO